MIKTTYNPSREIHRSHFICFAAFISLLTLAILPAKSQSYDFSSSNHGFVPATGGTSPNKSPFTYADGIWMTLGAESGSAQHSIATLTSPIIDVSGRTEIEIKHSYNFEENWDSGHLVLTINGTEQRAGVDIGEFADGGYEGLLPEQGNFVWTGMSSEAGVSRLVIEDVEAGSTPNPDGEWMLQIARNLTDCEAGFAVGKSHLIIDRDTKYTEKFKKLLDDSGIEIVLCPPRAPRCNAFAERFVKSIKFECLNELILLGRRHLEVSIEKYTSFYYQFRNHQGVDNEILTPREFAKDGPIECQSELGGTLNFYYRKAAWTGVGRLNWPRRLPIQSGDSASPQLPSRPFSIAQLASDNQVLGSRQPDATG